MIVEPTALPDVKLIHLDRFGDERGVFAETYDLRAFAEQGIDDVFVQDSWSVSYNRDTVRGLHFQAPPLAQAKLVRVPRGRVFDVVVDIRHGSPDFGRHVTLELNSNNLTQLYVPKGFAHGFCTMVDETEIVYKMLEHFSPDHSNGASPGTTRRLGSTGR